MTESKLTFRVQEIESGRSVRKIALQPEDLSFDDVRDVDLLEADVELVFSKTDHFIRVAIAVAADLRIVCDRSLQPFVKRVEGSYEVLFQPKVEQVTEGEDSKLKELDGRELTLSVDEEVRDTILLGLPIRRLHPDFLDEQGRPQEFETRTFGFSGEEDGSDPRWEALKKLKRNK